MYLKRQANYQRLDEAKLKLTKSDPTEIFGVGKAHSFDYLLHSHMLFYNCHNFQAEQTDLNVSYIDVLEICTIFPCSCCYCPCACCCRSY